jgi:hypothetical protein
VAAEEDRGGYAFTVVPRAWEVEEYLAAQFERAEEGKLAPFAQVRAFDGPSEAWGARFEGVLRSWSPSRAPGEDGLLRDSAIFSLVAAEWPATKAALRRRLVRQAAEYQDHGGGGLAGRGTRGRSG